MPPEEQPGQAFAAAVAGQPDSKSPAAAPRSHTLPGGGGRAGRCPAGGHWCPDRRGSPAKHIFLVPWVACLNAACELSWRRADWSFSAGLAFFCHSLCTFLKLVCL